MLVVVVVLVAMVADGAVRAVVERRERAREIRGNQLYFYYGASEQLKQGV